MPRTLFLTLGILLPVLVAAEPLAEPPVIESAGGSLGLLVVAREQRLDPGGGAARRIGPRLSRAAPPEGAAP